MHILVTIQLTLDMQEFEIPVTFYVLHRVKFDVIFGIYFLKQTKANIDIQSQILTLYGDLVGKIFLSNDTIIRTTEAVLISRRSLILVIVPTEFGFGLWIITIGLGKVDCVSN